jgi:hypothetical protein
MNRVWNAFRWTAEKNEETDDGFRSGEGDRKRLRSAFPQSTLEEAKELKRLDDHTYVGKVISGETLAQLLELYVDEDMAVEQAVNLKRRIKVRGTVGALTLTVEDNPEPIEGVEEVADQVYDERFNHIAKYYHELEQTDKDVLLLLEVLFGPDTYYSGLSAEEQAKQPNKKGKITLGRGRTVVKEVVMHVEACELHTVAQRYRVMKTKPEDPIPELPDLLRRVKVESLEDIPGFIVRYKRPSN